MIVIAIIKLIRWMMVDPSQRSFALWAGPNNEHINLLLGDKSSDMSWQTIIDKSEEGFTDAISKAVDDGIISMGKTKPS